MALRTGFAWNKEPDTFVPDSFHDSIAIFFFFFKARETPRRRDPLFDSIRFRYLLPRFSQLENFHNALCHERSSRNVSTYDSCLLKLFIESIGNERVPSNIYIHSSRIRLDEPCELVSTEPLKFCKIFHRGFVETRYDESAILGSLPHRGYANNSNSESILLIIRRDRTCPARRMLINHILGQ